MNRTTTDPQLIRDRQLRFAREAQEARLARAATSARPTTAGLGAVIRARFDLLASAIRGVPAARGGRGVGATGTRV